MHVDTGTLFRLQFSRQVCGVFVVFFVVGANQFERSVYVGISLVRLQLRMVTNSYVVCMRTQIHYSGYNFKTSVLCVPCFLYR